MELRAYWAILRRRWAAPLLLPVLVALFSAVQLRPWESQASSFNATVRMLVGVLPLESPGVAQYDARYYAWLTSEYLVDDFTEVLGTQLFAEAINARLSDQGIDVPAGLISAQANTGNQHRIISLTFTWHHAATLQAIAEATVAELEENAAAYFDQLGTQDASVRVLDPPVIVQQDASARERAEWPMRIFLAIVAGTGIAFFREYLDETVQRREELEEMGLQVLAAIPK